MIKEIRVHARAGQGAITTAMLLATAAFEDGKYALAFPHFGAQRMGAPMNAFVRISDAPIRVRSQITHPNYVLVQDPTLLKGFDVAAGLKPGGIIVINGSDNPTRLTLKTQGKVVMVPASRIALETVGRADRANTALIGAFAAASGELSLEALQKAVLARFSGAAAEKNIEALKRAYEYVISAVKN